MIEAQHDEAEPFEPALRPQFGLKALAFSLVAVSLTFALSRWLSTAIVVAVVFSGGLVALHVFSTALGRRLRASRPDEREHRQRNSEFPPTQPSEGRATGENSSIRNADAAELRERRSVATFASWTTVLVAGAVLGAACGWSFIADNRSAHLISTVAGLAAFSFLGAVAGGLGHALVASLLIAHRQSVHASEADGPRS